jgi:hypothetical protein
LSGCLTSLFEIGEFKVVFQSVDGVAQFIGLQLEKWRNVHKLVENAAKGPHINGRVVVALIED